MVGMDAQVKQQHTCLGTWSRDRLVPWHMGAHTRARSLEPR